MVERSRRRRGMTPEPFAAVAALCASGGKARIFDEYMA
jgi:hypothetical protein